MFELDCDILAYFQREADLISKIKAIDIIINNNIALIAAAVLGPQGTTAMYELDDGQVRLKVNYRSVENIVAANTALETMKQLYVNRLEGRTTVLRDRGTFRGWRGGPYWW